MEITAGATPRFRGRVAALFYLLNIFSGSLALVFIGRHLGLYADAANLTATAAYVIVTVLFYYIFKPVNRHSPCSQPSSALRAAPSAL